MDNYATHKTPETHKRLLRHRRFHLHFTSPSSSWLNRAGHAGATVAAVRTPAEFSPAPEGPDFEVMAAESGLVRRRVRPASATACPSPADHLDHDVAGAGPQMLA